MGENPYQPPPDVPPPPPAKKILGKEPFSHQAAKFSLFAPFILFLVNLFCVNSTLDDYAGTETGRQIAFLIGGLWALTVLAALVLGVVGVIGGIQRRAVWTIICAVFGILLNGGLILITAGVIVKLQNVPMNL